MKIELNWHSGFRDVSIDRCMHWNRQTDNVHERHWYANQVGQ